MSNIYGRQVVLPLTNKSGGSVAAGDVVIIDTSNDSAFTTTTTGQYQGSVGIAQETIASNATGRVLTAGEAALVNVPSSMTRGRFLETHTVVKQGTQNTTRRAGSFGQFMTGGTTPKAWLWGFPDNAGASGETVATSAIWDAAGDLVQGTGADTAAKLTLGAAGTVVRSTGSTNAYAFPPGYEFDYAQATSGGSVTATTEATASTIVAGNAVTYDGSTVVMVEFFIPFARPTGTSGEFLNFWLYDGASSIGRMAAIGTPASGLAYDPAVGIRRLTPSNAAHTYTIKASVSAGTGSWGAGAGGNTADMPAFIRITKV